MRTRVTLPLVVLLAFACQQQETATEQAATEEAPAVDIAAETAAFDQLDSDYEAAWNAHDAAAVASFWTEDGMIMMDDAPRIVGRAEIQKFNEEQNAEMPDRAIEIDREGLTISEAGDLATAHGTFTISGTGPDGNPVSMTAQYAAAYKKVDGQWKVYGVMGNQGGPAMEATEAATE